MKRLLKIGYSVMAIGLLVSSFAWAEPAAENFIPPPLEPQLSSDGNTLYNGAPPVIITDRPKPADELRRIPPPFDLNNLAETATATFTIDYKVARGADQLGRSGADQLGRSCTDFPEDAKASVIAAAAIWGNLLFSSVPIRISACWASLSDSVLTGVSAFTDCGRLIKDPPNAPRSNTYYCQSLANALAGYDLDETEPDMYITFNSNRYWYYGTDGDPWPWQLDLMTVALHEIGHGLGFGGSPSYSGGQGSLGVTMDDGSLGSVTIYDTFMKDGSGNPLTGYTNPSASLGGALTSGNLWFHGSNAMAANGGSRVKMFAPLTWGDGRSYTHLDYTTFLNTENQLMVSDTPLNYSIHDPGPITRGLLKDLGWHSAGGVPPAGMVLIPAGSFQMGDAIDGMSWAMPVHAVTLSAFYLDKYEVTKALWDEVYSWATVHGYGFDNAGAGTAANHPVQTVSWYDVVKWLNARSEKEGRTPVYYTNLAQTTIYKTGQLDVTNGMVKWTVSGYRLPTEAEWEYATRGGTTTRFYTGNCISTDQANYNGNYPESGCPAGQNRAATTAVGSFAANPWGLHDMAGNVIEWTWDWYGTYSSSAVTNPRGPGSGSYRILRGGSWLAQALFLRSIARAILIDFGDPSDGPNSLGFRSALNFATAGPCTYTLSLYADVFASPSATGVVTVTSSSSSCAWTAVSNASWITVTSGSSGTGSGTVSYSIAANTTGNSRTGTITIGGKTFTVTQTRSSGKVGLPWLLLLLGK